MKDIYQVSFLFVFSVFIISCEDDPDDPPPLGMIGIESSRVVKNGIETVIHISVDGLQSEAITTLGSNKLTNFYYLRSNGSFTDNARTDETLTYTLPNHTSQLTGRPVNGVNGHQMIFNDDFEEFNLTLHNNAGSYITGVFDVVHDFGLSTAMYVSKPKFRLFRKSWDSDHGAVDRVLPNSGRNKLDQYSYSSDTDNLVDQAIEDMEDQRFNYVFIHLKDPDEQGHENNWSLETESHYLNAVERVDKKLNKVISFINTNMDYAGKTVLIITADHGGEYGTNNHIFSRLDGYLSSAVIPFYVYGVNVPAAMDLYAWNPGETFDPGNLYPYFSDDLQPVRNADAANLIMELLGLPNVPGSSIDKLSYPW